MSDNLVTVKTILDFSETEREFNKLLNRLNSEAAIKVKIDSPNTNGLDTAINSFSKLNTIISSFDKLVELQTGGRNRCFSVL